jgi:hypothetical protein
VIWLPNFKPSAIDKYDGSTNPTEWMEVHQVAIEFTDGNLYVRANYLPICLLSSARTRSIGLPTGSVQLWSDLCRQFINSFRATCD